MKITSYKVGMLVDHPNRPAWGPGKIVHVDGSKVHVFFRDALERRAKPIVVEVVPLRIAASQTDAALDELPFASESEGSWLLPAHYKHAAFGEPAPKPKRVAKGKATSDAVA
jgi:hypothetical protein